MFQQWVFQVASWGLLLQSAVRSGGKMVQLCAADGVVAFGTLPIFVELRLNAVYVAVHSLGSQRNSVHIFVTSLGVPPRGTAKICFNRAG